MTNQVFEPTIGWLKEWLCANGYIDLSKKIDGDVCWIGLGRMVRNGDFPDDVVERLTLLLIADGDGRACSRYCRYIKDRDDVREAMIDSGDGWACYLYCRHVSDRDDVRKVMIASGDGDACDCYCRFIADRDDVRKVLFASGNAEAYSRYRRKVRMDMLGLPFKWARALAGRILNVWYGTEQ